MAALVMALAGWLNNLLAKKPHLQASYCKDAALSAGYSLSVAENSSNEP
jgi:hypothetical protein